MPAANPDLKTYPVLFVDDEPDIVETFRLDYDEDFAVLVATSGSQALDILSREPVAVLVADQRMPEMSGLEVIRRALEQRPDLIPIMLTGYTDPDALVEAINLGRVHRYIAKPWDSGELRLAIARAIEAFHLTAENARLAEENTRLLAEVQRANDRLAQENRYLKTCDSEVNGFGAIVGRGAAMQDVIALARRVLDSSTTVLLQGPTGTGKELIARAIHHEGSRRDRLFVAQNCGALTETLLASELFGHRKGAFTGAVADKKGLFELADGGTLFLDEISETSPALQVHLLRALQEREIQPIGASRPVKVDVRVIAATNRDLAAESRQGRFREDLYFRLGVFRIDLPPLARRIEDIPALADHFLRKSSVALNRTFAGISSEAMTALMAHDYRGNVRELQNLIERATLLAEPGERIGEEHLFDTRTESAVRADDGKPTLEDDLSRFEQQRIAGAIAQCGGNKSEAARQLGLTYRGLLKKMQRFGMATGGRQG